MSAAMGGKGKGQKVSDAFRERSRPGTAAWGGKLTGIELGEEGKGNPDHGNRKETFMSRRGTEKVDQNFRETANTGRKRKKGEKRNLGAWCVEKGSPEPYKEKKGNIRGFLQCAGGGGKKEKERDEEERA